MLLVTGYKTRMKLPPIEERFWSRVNKNGPVPQHCPELGPCWVWTAGRDSGGYGMLSYKKKSERAHRVAYLLKHGKIPHGKCVLHRCDNRLCVRDAHHFIGTKTVNTADMIAKGRQAKGEKKWSAKLTDAKVLDLRLRYAQGEVLKDLAAELGISEKEATFITTGRVWKHIGGPVVTGRATGDRHYSRTHPERLNTTGDKRSFGDRNGSRTHPEKRKRGEQQKHAKLTEAKVHWIRATHAARQYTNNEIGAMLDPPVSGVLVSLIARRKAWAHVP